MRASLVLSLLVTAFSALGCAGGTPPPQTPAGQGPATAEAPSADQPKTTDSSLPVEAAPVPPAPAECKTLAERVPPKAPGCQDAKSAIEGLALALSQNDAAERDAQLVRLEVCPALAAGVARALRAELAPVACGDAIVEPFLAQAPSGLRADVRDALMGLGFAARLARLVRDPPKLAPPYTKARVKEHVQNTLRRWIESQAKAVHSVSIHGSSLDGYGKGVAAVEAGLADLRFVEVVRAVPVPDEIAKDSELKNAYYGALDEALEPRKIRGRDAALVGLKKLAEAGALADERVLRARSVLSGLYSGRRIDALDSLLVPPLAPAAPKSSEEKLALRLPAFYADIVLAQADATKPTLLRALIERGLPKAARARLENEKALGAESRRLHARALLALGSRYWRAADFSAAKTALTGAKLAGPAKEESDLVAAIASALAKGPKDAAEMMLKGPHLPQGVADVAELDRIGQAKGKLAGMALFDAARLLEIARPADATDTYFKDVAARYTRAAELLTDPAHKKDAQDRAKAANETAAAIGAKKP